MLPDAAASATGMVYAPGYGYQRLAILGMNIVVKVASAHTNGTFTLLEYTAPPHFAGLPAHWHRHTSEAIYMLDGTLAWTIADKTMMVGRGSAVFIPPGVIHSCWNPTATSATWAIWYSPGGFDIYCEALAEHIAASPVWPPADRDMLADLAARYDHYDVTEQG